MPVSLAIDVALTPALRLQPRASSGGAGTATVVIDVVRATTSLCALLERGAARILLAPGIAEARMARARLGEGYLLAGEVAGARPPGFDLGNSPAEIAARDLRGQQVIFATTNGTRALRASRGEGVVLAGAFRNAGAVVRAALDAAVTGSASQVVFVCSGRDEQAAFDDALCAGYLVARLEEAARDGGRACALDGGAPIALSVWRDVARGGDLAAALAASGAGRAIAAIGLGADLALCAAIDTTAVVPALADSLDVEGIELLIVEPR
jgi:2-phosphosulfolactate phosphatase